MMDRNSSTLAATKLSNGIRQDS